jgi:hypothetical protein
MEGVKSIVDKLFKNYIYMTMAKIYDLIKLACHKIFHFILKKT